MTKAFGPKRLKSLRNKYLPLALIVAASFFSVTGKAQTVPTVDSIHRWVNAKVTNTVLTAFTNRDLNRILHAILNRIDSASGGGGGVGVDLVQIINDSSFRYRLNGVYSSPLSLKGVYDQRTKVEKVFEANDSTLAVVSNGPSGLDTTLITKGGGSGGGTEALDNASMVRANSKLYSKNPVFTALSSLRAVSTTDLNTGFIYRTNVNGVLGEWYYDAFDATTADDTAMTLVTSGGKRLKRLHHGVINPQWWGAVADYNGSTGTDNGPAFNKMFRWLEGHGNYKIDLPAGRYLVSTRITLPYTLPTVANQATPYLIFEGNGAHIFSNAAIDMFYRMPANDADVGNMNNNYKLKVQNLFVNGDRVTAGQTAFRVACGYGWVWDNVQFVGFDTAVVASFMTKSSWVNCFFTVQQKVDIKLQSLAGIVGTQEVAGSASNDNTIHNVRFFEFTGAHAAVMLFGTDNTVIDHYVIEGAQPRYGIYADYQNSSVVNALFINDGWFESNSGSPSVNFRIKSAGLTRIRNTQRSYADTLFDFDGSADAAQFEIDGLTYTGNLAAKPFSVGTSNPTFSGRSIAFKNIDVGTADLVVNASKWVGGQVPQNMSLEYFAAANGGVVYKSTNAISFFPRASVGSIVDRYLYTESNFVFNTDNQGSIGGSFTTGSNRPKAVHVGESGVIVDTLGRVWWGRSAYFTPDVSIARDSAKRVKIMDGGFNLADLKLRVGKFFGRSGYDTAYSITSLADNDFVTKQHLVDAVAGVSPTLFFNPSQFTPNDGTSEVTPVTIDSSKFATTYRTDTLHVRDSILQAQINAFGRKVDTIWRVPGVDSLYFKIAGVQYAIKDSTGAGGGSGDNWGAEYVRTNSFLTGKGTIPDPLKPDTTTGKLATQTMIKTYLVDAGVGIQVLETTDALGNKKYTVTNTGSPGSNPWNAIDARNYGWTSDVTIPGTGPTFGGTDNKIALQNAINATPDNGWLIVPTSGLIATPLDTIRGPKTLHIIFLQNIYTNGNDIFRIVNNTLSGSGGGDYEQHKIYFYASVIGRNNIPSHNRTNYLGGTGPAWGSWTGCPVSLFNVNQCYVYFNRVTGFEAVIDLVGSNGAGSQENTIVGRRWTANKYGVRMRSLDGSSFVDKNVITGPDYGTLRVGGMTPIYIDGWAGLVGGEQWNGAFRSNTFHMLIENADSIATVRGDVTEPLFDLTIEGGTSTGVFSDAPMQMLSTGPNYVRSPTYTGRGYFDVSRLGSGSSGSMGLGGRIYKVIWSPGSTVKYGEYADIDNAGNIIISCEEGLNQANRNTAPAFVRFKNIESSGIVSLTSSSYTVLSGIRHVKMNNAAASVTLPTASSFPGREIIVYNLNANKLSTFVGATPLADVPGNMTIAWVSDGSSWIQKTSGGQSRYTLFYTSTSSTSITAASSGAAQSLIGGSKNVGAINAGDVIELEGSGQIQAAFATPTTPTFVFTVGSNTVSVGFSSALPANNLWNYKYEFKAIPTTTGTTVTTFVEYHVTVQNASTGVVTEVRYFNTLSSALNTSSATVNVTGYFNNSGNTWDTYTNMIEIKRK